MYNSYGKFWGVVYRNESNLFLFLIKKNMLIIGYEVNRVCKLSIVYREKRIGLDLNFDLVFLLFYFG